MRGRGGEGKRTRREGKKDEGSGRFPYVSLHFPDNSLCKTKPTESARRLLLSAPTTSLTTQRESCNDVQQLVNTNSLELREFDISDTLLGLLGIAV